VSDDYLSIKYFLPFNGFELNPSPNTVDEYYTYKNNSIDFINKRNNRIKEYESNNNI
jgi:hypothetical protein